MTQRALTLLALGAALAAAPPAAASSRLRVDATAYPHLDLTFVASRAGGGTPAVEEDGRPAAGVSALNLGEAKSIVLALDRSVSMAGGPLADARRAAASFLAAKPSSDRVAVVAFGSQAVQLAPFATGPDEAAAALRALTVDSRTGTALYDGLELAARSLAAEPPGGRVVILLTDGRDVSSVATLEHAIGAARRAGAIVHPIAIGGAGLALAPLREIAARTGGRLAVAPSSAELLDVYAALAEELRRTWRLTYSTAARPGERVQIAVSSSRGTAAASFALPGPAAAGRRHSPVVASKWDDLLLALAVGGLVVLALRRVAIYRRTVWLQTTLAVAHAPSAEPTRARTLRERLVTVAALLHASERAFGHLKPLRALRRLLARADMPLRAVELLYAMLGAALVAAMLGAAAGARSFVLLLLLATGGWLPYALVALRARRRRRAFEEQLPDLLMTLAASLKAGHSFRQGLQSAADEGQEPARKELKRVLSESRLGHPLESALAESAERIGSSDFAFVASAVTIQREVGGSLAGIFDMVADTVRERQQFARRIKAVTATGRMSAYVLLALPPGLALALTAINAEYMAPLFHTSTGQRLLILAAAMMVFGWLVLRRVVAFKG